MSSSFKDLDKPDLLRACEEFGVDADARWSPKRIIEAILNDGITWAMYKESFPDVVEEAQAEETTMVVPEAGKPSPKKGEKRQLVKMERANPSFMTMGYRFTQEHPFVLMPMDDALFIIANEEGFRLANMAETEEFYK